ncbi:MAG TPA: hypothetical protein VJ698_12440 [Noviherbaspirillum sp.]|uniref:hypothetical protein n=1 Tax=Noviherbaspirillum sp. TaxID=1926288 RepID=UPI002B46C7E8|nr:hypothetical protein [Noviherbaspirillum sp.]HJV86273.1 hypothetical protein [Noviherbaspirillum sp.]
MDNDNVIRLSGPFRINDSLGRTWAIRAIRIYDEGYGIIDVYVDLDAAMEDDPLYEDPLVIRQILARLRMLGYDGPDFGAGDSGLQDDKLIVLEAPEEFGHFAASRGWKNLAEAYEEDDANAAASGDATMNPCAQAAFGALMKKLGVK